MKKLSYIVPAIAFAIIAAGFFVGRCAHAQAITCPASGADEARLCWSNATHNVDGSAIAATGTGALKETRIRRSECTAAGGFGAIIQVLTVPPDVLTVLFEDLPPARHCFQVRHVNNAGEQSGWSALARKTTTASAPPKPRQPSVTIA